jgi:SAM-dependent methyltransferase
MNDQARAWGAVAKRYRELFVDPYHAQGSNPVLRALEALADKRSMVVGDLGCGTGVLLPKLARWFKEVIAIDFSEEMLEQARESCRFAENISFHHLAFEDLHKLPRKLDVAVSINSLVSADVSHLDRGLAAMRATLVPGGRLLGIVPSLEGLHYHVMHLIDLGVARGMDLVKAQEWAARKAELHGYDFKTATFTFDRIRQHLWLREEVRHRLRKAGFRRWQVLKARLPWDQFAEGRALARVKQSWDWAFVAKRSMD